MNIFKRILALALIAGVLPAAVPVRPTDSNDTELGLAPAGKKVTYYLQAITTGGTTITTTATYVQMLFCTNTSAGSVTLTVADTQGSPVTFFSQVTIAANSVTLLAANNTGLYMQGVKITVNTNSAVSCQVQGVQ